MIFRWIQKGVDRLDELSKERACPTDRYGRDPELGYVLRLIRDGMNREKRAATWREKEVYRLACVLRALERVANRPCRTPKETRAALQRVRLILHSTGKPEAGECADCGFVALQRANRCPRCDSSEPPGLDRNHPRVRGRWLWWRYRRAGSTLPDGRNCDAARDGHSVSEDV